MKRMIFLLLLLTAMLITINCVGGFEIAITQDDARSVAGHIKAGQDINKRDILRNGTTALMKATHCLSFEVAKLLIDKGADVNAKDHFGRTALMYAFHLMEPGYTIYNRAYETRKRTETGKSEADMIKLLIANGADVNSMDDHGITALHYAAENHAAECIKLLKDLGADVNAKDAAGNAAWAYAAHSANINGILRASEIMDLLLDENVQFSSDIALFVWPKSFWYEHLNIFEEIEGKDVPLEGAGIIKKLKPGLHIFKADWFSGNSKAGPISIPTQLEAGHIYTLVSRVTTTMKLFAADNWAAEIQEIPVFAASAPVLVDVFGIQRTENDPLGLTRAAKLEMGKEYWLVSGEIENPSEQVLELAVPNPRIFLSSKSSANILSIDLISPMKIEAMNQLGETLKSGLSSDFKFTQKVNPGEKMAITIVFEVPKTLTVEDFELHFLKSPSRPLKINK